MDVERIRHLLPEHPRQGMLEYVKQNCNGELGPEMAIFNRESIRVLEDYYEDMRMIMTPEQVEEAEKKIKNTWGAWVNFTCCNDDCFAGYVTKTIFGEKGIIFAEGEDGSVFPGWVDGTNPMGELTVTEGDQFTCPFCGEVVELVHKSKLRHGRTYQVQVCSVELVENYTVLVFWLVSRVVSEFGYSTTEVKPREAIVIDEKGRPKRFAHTRKYMNAVALDLREWAYRSRFEDSFQSIYYDWPSINHRKIGGFCWSNIPDLTGTTGEKTGIIEYIRAGGNWPAVYLKCWQSTRAIENLLKAGWGKAVVTEIDDKVNTNRGYGWMTNNAVAFRWGNWDEVKPSRMLGMTKQEAKQGSQWRWNNELMFEWWGYRNTDEHSSATVFNDYYRKVGLAGVQQTVGMLENGCEGYDLPKLMRYFDKFPDLKPADVLQYLIDVRTMAEELSPAGEITFEQMWPKNLIEVHDRLDRVHRSVKDINSRKKYAAGFEANVEKYKGLDWNDGELCIRIARTNGELIDEGQVLDHCVGGYGENHITGKDVIFFVRRYRRPERSYYTLDIRFTQGAPYEVQLHGYGNERHGPNKKYSHSIPKKVRAFVDRWKTEVLKPWFLAKNAEQVKKAKKKNRRAG